MSSVAKITELSVRSEKSFEDAVQVGVARASQTLRNGRRNTRTREPAQH